MSLMEAAFLAPATAPATGSRAPAAPLVAAPLPQATLASSALAVAGRSVSVAAMAACALTVVGAGRHRRTARKALPAAVPATGAPAVEVPPPPPPFQPGEQIGALAPLGFFDPLGFTSVGDEKGFNKLRASELKHGRVAMMASIGLVGQHFIKFPGFEKTPAGLGALGTGEGVFGFFGLFVFSAVLELAWREDPSKEPGNFGNPFGVDMYNEDMRNKEISNGRMAMISVLGIFAAELATGKDAIQQFGF